MGFCSSWGACPSLSAEQPAAASISSANSAATNRFIIKSPFNRSSRPAPTGILRAGRPAGLGAKAPAASGKAAKSFARTRVTAVAPPRLVARIFAPGPFALFSAGQNQQQAAETADGAGRPQINLAGNAGGHAEKNAGQNENQPGNRQRNVRHENPFLLKSATHFFEPFLTVLQGAFCQSLRSLPSLRTYRPSRRTSASVSPIHSG